MKNNCLENVSTSLYFDHQHRSSFLQKQHSLNSTIQLKQTVDYSDVRRSFDDYESKPAIRSSVFSLYRQNETLLPPSSKTPTSAITDSIASDLPTLLPKDF